MFNPYRDGGSLKHQLYNTYHVHFKVDQLSTGQSNDNLPFIDGTLCNVLLAMCLPFIDTLVSLNVTNALRVYLRKTRARSHDPEVAYTKVHTCNRASSPSW